MGLRYYNPQHDGDIIYSCDMLQLQFFVHKYFTNFLNNLYKFLDSYCVVNIFRSFGLGKYRYLLDCDIISCGGKVIIGYDLFRNGSYTSASCMIKFNPNKCDSAFMFKLLEFIGQYLTCIDGKYYRLMRYDLAVDIPICRDRVLLVKNGKRRYTKIIDSSLTEYLGTRNSDGFVKVYDKAAESELPEDTELTRIEITCADFESLKLPEVYLLGSVEEDLTTLNDTQCVLVELLRKLPDTERQQYFKRLGRRISETIKPYVFSPHGRFNFNLNCIMWVQNLCILPFLTLNFKSKFYEFDSVQIAEIEKDITDNPENYHQFDINDYDSKCND